MTKKKHYNIKVVSITKFSTTLFKLRDKEKEKQTEGMGGRRKGKKEGEKEREKQASGLIVLLKEMKALCCCYCCHLILAF